MCSVIIKASPSWLGLIGWHRRGREVVCACAPSGCVVIVFVVGHQEEESWVEECVRQPSGHYLKRSLAGVRAAEQHAYIQSYLRTAEIPLAYSIGAESHSVSDGWSP